VKHYNTYGITIKRTQNGQRIYYTVTLLTQPRNVVLSVSPITIAQAEVWDAIHEAVNGTHEGHEMDSLLLLAKHIIHT